MIGKVKTECDYGLFASNCSTWQFEEGTSEKVELLELLDYMIDNQALIVCGEDSGEVMWLDEIRFDYSNGEIYVPYVKSDYLEVEKTHRCLKDKYKRNVVAYNNYIDKFTIYKDNRFTVDKLYFIFNNTTNIDCCSIRTENLEFNQTIGTQDIKDIFDLYIKQCYLYTKVDSDMNKMYAFNKSKLNRTELNYISKHNLEYYSDKEYKEFNVTRKYKLSDMLECFSADELGVSEPYNQKRYQFESRLFRGILTGVDWCNWTKGNTDKIKKGLMYFGKYKEKEISFIFKKEWYYWVR